MTSSPPSLTGMLETALYAEDLEATGGFYARLLGIEPFFADERMRAFALGSTVLLVFQKGQTLAPAPTPGGTIPPHDGSGPMHLAFAVPSAELAAWEDRLGTLGIAIESRVSWPRGGTSVYFRDCENRSVELATPGLWPNY